MVLLSYIFLKDTLFESGFSIGQVKFPCLFHAKYEKDAHTALPKYQIYISK